MCRKPSRTFLLCKENEWNPRAYLGGGVKGVFFLGGGLRNFRGGG